MHDSSMEFKLEKSVAVGVLLGALGAEELPFKLLQLVYDGASSREE